MQAIIEFVKANLTNLTILSIAAGILIYIAVYVLCRSYSLVMALIIRCGYYIYVAGLIMFHLLSVFILKITRLKRWTTLLDIETEPMKEKLWNIGKEKPVFVQNVHRKKFKKVIGLSILVFMLIAVSSNTAIYEKLKLQEVMEYPIVNVNLFDEMNKLKDGLQQEDESSTAIVYIKLIDGLAQGNVRAAANLEASEIGVAKSGEHYLYLDEMVHDGKRDWYKIRLENGKEGWISSAITVMIEVANNK